MVVEVVVEEVVALLLMQELALGLQKLVEMRELIQPLQVLQIQEALTQVVLMLQIQVTRMVLGQMNLTLMVLIRVILVAVIQTVRSSSLQRQ